LLTEEEKSQFDGFAVGNIESMNFPFNDVSFNVIICGDVLEHLIDPYTTIENLKKHLSPNGIIITSIPNIREWETLKSILFHGDFKYQDSGILDKTHLRFFCKKNSIALFENAGYTVQQVKSSFLKGKVSLSRKIRVPILQFLTFGNYVDFQTIQYFIVAQNRQETE
jgi:2-polyprenyl-3-methyl-5-hydroxy-6-metoxy-1,4-benzoquinol methylase